jgi:hypothetical protein
VFGAHVCARGSFIKAQSRRAASIDVLTRRDFIFGEFALRFVVRFSRFVFFSSFGLLAATWGPHVHAQAAAALTAAQAERVNAAGAQRMLSQRMAKAYAQAVLGVLPAQSTEILANSAKLFAANQALLRGAGLPAETQRLIAAVDAQAAPLLAAVASPPTKEGLTSVAKAADDTLAAAEALVKGLPALSIPGASLITLSGRQRMLSQRAAKLFMLYQGGAKTPEVRAAYEKAMRDFDAVIKEFSALSDEFPFVRDNVELASVQMDFFRTAARSFDAPSEAQKNTVARSSERVLETMDEMTKEVAAKFTAKEPVGAAVPAKKK